MGDKLGRFVWIELSVWLATTNIYDKTKNLNFLRLEQPPSPLPLIRYELLLTCCHKILWGVPKSMETGNLPLKH